MARDINSNSFVGSRSNIWLPLMYKLLDISNIFCQTLISTINLLIDKKDERKELFCDRKWRLCQLQWKLFFEEEEEMGDPLTA